ncbi:Primosomal N' [Gossypium arboreum]|uniref:Primosomal N n=1 Tax=Gossypium arboreum TaxID=29729 RepID=A0A0B0MQV0_GOSAR|nr:Primosomal N' [Gossypium arboreum]
MVRVIVYVKREKYNHVVSDTCTYLKCKRCELNICYVNCRG